MADKPAIDYTSIDWETILADLKTYLKNTDTFKDADFEGSNISTIMELVSYVGALNSYYLNAAANEVFLPTARLYKNLNKIAKLVGYHPRGYKSASMDIVLTLDTEYTFGSEEKTIHVPSYSDFKSTKSDSDGNQINFINQQDVSYRIKGFGTKYIEKDDINYDGTPLNLIETTENLKKQSFSIESSEKTPFIKLDNENKIEQTVYDELTCESSGDVMKDVEYAIVFSAGSPPSLSIVKATPNIGGDEMLRFKHDLASGKIIVTQNYSQSRFYLGYMGQRNLSSVRVIYSEVGSRIGQIELKVGENMPPYKVLIDGEVYSFPAESIISSSEFEDGKFSNTNSDLNLVLKVSGSAHQNFTSEIILRDTPPTNGEASLGTIEKNKIDESGNIPYSEIGDLIDWEHVPETIKINNLRQGTPSQTLVFEDGSVSADVDELNVNYDPDRNKYRINTDNVSQDDIRIFVKSPDGINEWNRVPVTEQNLESDDEVFFARINADKKIEIWFGDGIRGKQIRGKRFNIVALETSGEEGNIRSENMEGVNITGFSGRIFNTQQYLQSGIRSSSTLTDSEGDRVKYDIKQGYGGTGGGDPEDTEELRDNIGRFERTQDTIVSEQDYIDFLNQNYDEILADVNVLNYHSASNLDLMNDDELEKHFFNTIFILGVPRVGNSVLQYQKDQIIEEIQKKFRSMLTPTHVFVDASLVPIDVIVRYKRDEAFRRSKVTVESEIKKSVTDFFDREKRGIGEKIFHSNLVNACLVQGTSSVEVMMQKDREKELVASDYNIDIETGDYENENDLNALKSQLLRELDEKGILNKYQPLFDVEETVDPEAGITTRKWTQGNDLYLSEKEFPVLGDIVMEEEI